MKLNRRIERFDVSAELAAIAVNPAHIPTEAEQHGALRIVNKNGGVIYKYLNFDQIEEYVGNAKEATSVSS